MTVVTKYQADDDIDAAAEWLESLNAGSGPRFFAAVRAFLADVAFQPRRHPSVSRPPRGREVRQGPIDGYQFLVTFEVTPTQLVVWSFGHAKRRSQPWWRRMAP